MYAYNILSVLNLFDKYIYSNVSESSEELASSSLHTFITWPRVHEVFPKEDEKELLHNSLNYYAQTLIEIQEENLTFIIPLVESYSITSTGVNITHNYKGLKCLLYRTSNIVIHNSVTEVLFTSTFPRCILQGEILYSFLSSGYKYTCTPDELRSLLKTNYTNAELHARVLRPAEKSVLKLYQEAKIPFYFQIQMEKSIVGYGGRIMAITFELIDYIVLLRLKRMRAHYMEYIMEQLMILFPFDYPFLEEGIECLSDDIVASIFTMIKNIESDPDYHKVELSTLIRYKLQENYKVILQRFIE